MTTMEDLYPGGAGYHSAHEAYLHAVAAALAAAGFPNDGGNAEANDPRDGFVDLDLERLGSIWPDDEEVAVCWQEERGWWILTITDPARSNGRFVYELGVATIASPSTVVAAVAERAGLSIDVAADEHPDADFSEHAFEDDDVPFELALRHYVATTP